MIYRDQVSPEQWLMSKIIPVHKKGDKNLFENYRPFANLCCVSKSFEKLIVKRINDIEIFNGVPFGGKQQHGFIKNKSTVIAGLVLQSLIARAIDDDCCVALASIDLSAAFDVVDVELLIKHLTLFNMTKIILHWLV